MGAARYLDRTPGKSDPLSGASVSGVPLRYIRMPSDSSIYG